MTVHEALFEIYDMGESNGVADAWGRMEDSDAMFRKVRDEVIREVIRGILVASNPTRWSDAHPPDERLVEDIVKAVSP